MPRNGTGTYSLPQVPFVPGTTIQSAAVNSDFSDIASALTGSVAADGQTPMTGGLKLIDGTLNAPALKFTTDPTLGLSHLSANSLSFVQSGAAVLGINFGAFGVSGNVLLQSIPNNLISNAILVPVGMVVDFAGAAAPAGWLLCFGQSVLRSDYPELFLAIGTTYGAADDSHFSLPDYRGRTSAAPDNMGGSAANRLTATTMSPNANTVGGSGGAETETIAQANLPAVNFTVSGITLTNPTHTHTVPIVNSQSFQSGNTAIGKINGTSDVTTSAANPNVSVATQGTAASGGSGTALPVVQPTILINKIVFAAR